MRDKKKLSQLSSFKIVLIYAIVSAAYIYTSDYFLESLIHNVDVLSRVQTLKGLAFIIITSFLLYILVKRNIDKTSAFYQEIIDVKQRSDEQTLQSKEEYLTLFNNSPLPMWLFDFETLQFLHVNDAACRMYGFSHKEYMSMTLKDIHPKEDVPMMEKLLSITLKNDVSLLSEVIRHEKKNGKIMQVKVKTAPAIFEGKKVRLASAMDVTAEIDIQNKLMETNSKLQLASDIANLGYWTYDLQKSVIQWSDETYKIFDVDPKTFELSLDNIKSYFHPEDQSTFNLEFYEKINDKSIDEKERRIITPDGNIKWLLERICLVRDAQGKAIKLLGIALDITKRKLHEQEIWESNERFKILAKATVEAIIDWDITNDTVFWGDGFQTMLGYDLSSYDKDLWKNNLHPDDREKVLNDLNEAITNPEKLYFNAEFRFLKANREIAYVQHRAILIRDSKGKATRVLGAMIDLTDTLDRMRKIEQQNKALREIAWTQSHVVRAPLANLLGLIQLLRGNLGKDGNELVDYIVESAEKLDKIIHEIVNKAKEIDN